MGFRGAKEMRRTSRRMGAAAAGLLAVALTAWAAKEAFHNAPASAAKSKNPLAGNAAAEKAGATLYAQNCAACHGKGGEGNGNVPGLKKGPTQTATDGEVFWFITTGSVANGMPGWTNLSKEQRWQIVSFVKTMGSGRAKASATAEATKIPSPASAPAPTPPFTDFRYEKPGTMHKVTVADLPKPYATASAGNSPKVVPRPENAWPIAPEGFQVQLVATGFKEPRTLMKAPNGDIFVAESSAGAIRVLRGISAEGKPEKLETFATDLKRPYGIAFYPPGPEPQYVYIGNVNEVVRFPYRNGDLKARGPKEHIADLPEGGGHWTRALVFTPDGKKLLVAVGSASNVDDTDTTPAEKDRADILEFHPDGSGKKVYAYGIRNAGGGITINPADGVLWCSVNERDALGDNLVPDYITHVEPGGFYGWPWWYLGAHQDPRHEGKRADLKEKAIVPDVLLQPHMASLQFVFYDGKNFPGEYAGDIIAAEHGSWNKSVRVGYELIRLPMKDGKATGEYEDFVTGFVLPDGNVWGRPVGVAVAQDGSLLFSDDGSNTIWRLVYTGAQK